MGYTEKFVDEDTEALSNNGKKDLNELYKNNQKFKDEIINFVEDKAKLDREKVLDKRLKYNALISWVWKLWPSLPSLNATIKI